MPTAIATAVKKPVIVRVGRRRPSLLDTITAMTGDNASGANVDITCPFFSMRPLMSRSSVIEEEKARALEKDPDGYNIAYDWQEEDVAEEGEFMGWWTFTPKGQSLPEDTPEFPIIITDHGPGEGIETGIIVAGVAAEMPTTFDALKDDVLFGDRFLQAKAELIKYKVLGVTTPPDQEVNLHPMLLAYFSKRLALELIKPGIDYWSRQHKTITSTQTSEVASYPEMIKSLEKLDTMLRLDCKELWDEVQFLVPGLPQRGVMQLPTSDLAGIPAIVEPVTVRADWTSRLHEWGGYLDLGVYPFP